MVLNTTGLASNEQGFSNCCFVTPGDLALLAEQAGVDAKVAADRGVLCAVNEAIFFVKGFDRALPNTIGVGMMQRMAGNMMMNAPVPVLPFRLPRGAKLPLASIQLEVDLLGKAAGDVSLDASEVADHLHRTLHNHVFKLNQSVPVAFKPELSLKVTVRGFEYLDLSGGSGGAAAGGAAAKGASLEGGFEVGGIRFGQFLRDTEVQLRKSASAATLKITGSSSSKGSQLFAKGFNFEALGIGGLNKEFQDIFRRAFASRVVPPDIMRKMGQKHVRGMLLYGPPGCGKTLIARQIGKALQARPPKIVNGPEILNKYVGQSEENIRALFADAEKEQAEAGDDSELHIIIFDEFDAICRQRGTTGGGTGVNDSIVNQLLSKIDGVEALNNILLIGMTNRKDMIDEAVLRPGRLEVHVEVGLPDEEGRVQILNIHTGSMRKGGLIADDVSIPELAARTKNYTGAELEGLVRAACTHLYARRIDMSDLSKSADFKGAQVTREDFERALADVQPAFGVKEEELARLVANGIVSYGPDFDAVEATLSQLVRQVASSERSGLVSAILTGPPGSGKSALTAHIARLSGFPFVKRISGETLVSLHETGKSDAIAKCFNDAHKSPLSLIILDDIERIIEYVRVGHRFSNAVLQTLLVLVKALPPVGRRLLILGTTSVPELLDDMELMSAFQLQVRLPLLTEESHFRTVLAATELMAPEEADAAAKHLVSSKGVPIKKLLNTLEMARLDAESAGAGPAGGAAVGGAGAASPAVASKGGAAVTFDRFVEAAVKWGL